MIFLSANHILMIRWKRNRKLTLVFVSDSGGATGLELAGSPSLGGSNENCGVFNGGKSSTNFLGDSVIEAKGNSGVLGRIVPFMPFTSTSVSLLGETFISV